MKSVLINRRNLLLGITAAGGLIAAGWMARPYLRRLHRKNFPTSVPTDPAAFLFIDQNGVVTLLSKHTEIGQGIMTGLATIVAEEMDADWAQMRVEHAPADRDLYQNLIFGRQITAASSSIANSWQQMRLIGAGARRMLMSAASEEWAVDVKDIVVEDGIIKHDASGRAANFGEMADAAKRQPVPDAKSLELKSQRDFKLIGGDQRRIDGEDKLSGQAVFSIDVTRPEMLRATVLRSPRFGGKLLEFDATAALNVKGVVEVMAVPSGVAVLAEDSWTAIRARQLITAKWDDSSAETRSTDEIFAAYRSLAKTEGVEALAIGDAGAKIDASDAVEVLEFQFDYLPHAPMEPLNAVLHRTPTGVDVWASCQAHTLEQEAIARVFDIPPESVNIHTQFGGSSFGRRAYPRSDWLTELAEIAKASRLARPVQIIWTREDDLTGGAYRPMSLHRAELAFGDNQELTAWRHRVVCQSVVKDTPWEAPRSTPGWDAGSVGALREFSYGFSDFHLESHSPNLAIPVGFWRSIGDTHNVFVLETIVDIAAQRLRKDPLLYRIDLLNDAPRQQAVLRAAAGRAGWTTPVGDRRGRGIALSFDIVHDHLTTVAMVADVDVLEAGFKVSRIVAAVDCGVVINPDIVRAQVEGSIAFALSNVLRPGISVRKGIVEQRNFDTFEPVRFTEMPAIEVEILTSHHDPSGIGEAAVASVAPAISNALFAATGNRFFSLPLF